MIKKFTYQFSALHHLQHLQKGVTTSRKGPQYIAKRWVSQPPPPLLDNEPKQRVVKETVNFPVDESIGLKMFIKKSMFMHGVVMTSTMTAASGLLALEIYNMFDHPVVSGTILVTTSILYFGGFYSLYRLFKLPCELRVHQLTDLYGRSCYAYSLLETPKHTKYTVGAALGAITVAQSAFMLSLMSPDVLGCTTLLGCMVGTSLAYSAFIAPQKMASVYTPTAVSVLGGLTVHSLASIALSLWIDPTSPIIFEAIPLFINTLTAATPIALTNAYAYYKYSKQEPDPYTVSMNTYAMLFALTLITKVYDFFFTSEDELDDEEEVLERIDDLLQQFRRELDEEEEEEEEEDGEESEDADGSEEHHSHSDSHSDRNRRRGDHNNKEEGEDDSGEGSVSI